MAICPTHLMGINGGDYVGVHVLCAHLLAQRVEFAGARLRRTSLNGSVWRCIIKFH